MAIFLREFSTQTMRENIVPSDFSIIKQSSGDFYEATSRDIWRYSKLDLTRTEDVRRKTESFAFPSFSQRQSNDRFYVPRYEKISSSQTYNLQRSFPLGEYFISACRTSMRDALALSQRRGLGIRAHMHTPTQGMIKKYSYQRTYLALRSDSTRSLQRNHALSSRAHMLRRGP